MSKRKNADVLAGLIKKRTAVSEFDEDIKIGSPAQPVEAAEQVVAKGTEIEANLQDEAKKEKEVKSEPMNKQAEETHSSEVEVKGDVKDNPKPQMDNVSLKVEKVPAKELPAGELPNKLKKLMKKDDDLFFNQKTTNISIYESIAVEFNHIRDHARSKVKTSQAAMVNNILYKFLIEYGDELERSIGYRPFKDKN